MIIVEPSYGLGNTMFQYAFLCELRKRGKRACFILHNNIEIEHNGYELDKIFSLSPYASLKPIEYIYIKTLEFLANKNYTIYKKIIPKLFKIIKVKENFIYYPEVFDYNGNCLFRGTWQSLKYFSTVQANMQSIFKFNENKLNNFTLNTLRNIQTSNSVSIHLRGGDYFKDQFNGGFYKCCPKEYYFNAITEIEKKISNPTFFIFTNDLEYAKHTFKEKKYIIVNGNYGKDSWQDMFLMSRCKHNIIANSTFSWWAAFLNQNPHKTIIAPKKWWYFFKHDDVVPNEWVRI